MSYIPRHHTGLRPFLTRREMLRQTSTGFGMLALSALLADRSYAGLAQDGVEGPLAAKAPHFTPKVKNVIFCYMSGGLSHIDSFDPKPRLAAEAGQPMPFQTERTMFNQDGNILPSPWAFTQHGKSGIPVSALFPHIGSVADELTVIRSMTAPFMEHAQANFYFHCGMPFTGFPSVGAWVTYGLGTENQNLPGFVVLGSGGIPLGGVNVFGNGFLPAIHQGSMIYPENAEPLNNVQPQETDRQQRDRLSVVGDLDSRFLERVGGNQQVEAAIDNYEIAYRMQTAVPELVDLAGETEATKKLYGLDSSNASTAAYGRQCLVARRLVERGVRFVELTMVGTDGMGQAANPWDQHTKLEEGHTANAMTVDKPVAGLVKDLKSRGLLDETLVIFSGEFGRTPFVQGTNGRDHNPYGFSLWLAGGGLKKGFVYGQTDDYGYRVVENAHTVRDLHATVLTLLGLDYQSLTYRFGGRDFRLADVDGHPIRGIIA
tara:strand:- start:16246 stop:17706 length:1461 start_codon:yes stop_codon:yes gene_type:complete